MARKWVKLWCENDVNDLTLKETGMAQRTGDRGRDNSSMKEG